VRPILEQRFVIPQQCFQVGRVIFAQATERHQQLRAGDDVDRVDLQAGDAADNVEQVGAAGVRPRRFQLRSENDQTAGFGRG